MEKNRRERRDKENKLGKRRRKRLKDVEERQENERETEGENECEIESKRERGRKKCIQNIVSSKFKSILILTVVLSFESNSENDTHTKRKISLSGEKSFISDCF